MCTLELDVPLLVCTIRIIIFIAELCFLQGKLNNTYICGLPLCLIYFVKVINGDEQPISARLFFSCPLFGYREIIYNTDDIKEPF